MKRECPDGLTMVALAGSLAAVILGVPPGRFQVRVSAQAQTTTPPQAQKPQKPTFSTAVEYVEVDARVTDGKGNPVRNLSKDDFRLLEDGKEQVIDSFAAIDIPIESTSSSGTTTTSTTTQRIEPDVAVNHYQPDESRVYTIVLDDRQIDALRTQDTKRIVKTFIERDLGPRDLAAIVSTSGRTDISQTLTSNKTLLLKAVDGFMGAKLESEAIRAYNGTTGGGDLGYFFEADASLRAVREVATWMGGIRGRSKVLLLVSEGPNFNYDDSFNPNATLFLEEEKRTSDAARHANVTVYGIDPRGLYAFDELTSLGPSTAAATAAAVATASGPRSSPQERAGADTFVGGSAQTTLTRAFKAEVDRARMSLRSIAAETGGAVSFQNDFQAVLDRIVSQHSTYYLLGYYPKNTRQDGKTRAIDVKVNRRGVTVVARRGYREPDAKAAATPPVVPGPSAASVDLRDALNSPLPLDGLALTATAAAFRQPDGQASIAVIVEAPAGNIDVTERDGKFVGAVEMSTVTVDRLNKMTAGETTRIDLQFTRESSDRLKQLGFRTLSKLDNIKPGRYQVRVAFTQPGTPKRGSVWYDVDVPDFSKDDLAMSGLMLASTEQAAVPTGNAGKLFSDVLPMPPTTRRQFRASDELIAFAEVYANRTPSTGVKLALVVADERARVVFRREEEIPSEDFASEGIYRSTSRLPLAGLEAGNYVLTLEATRKTDNTKVAVRAVPFRVVP